MQPEVKAAVAIIELKASAEVLILKRATNPLDPWSGHYSLPGGMKENDETLLATALRECEEETGIALHSIHPSTRPIASAGKKVGHELWVQPFLFVLDHKPKIELDLSEMEKALWVPLDKIHQNSIETKSIPNSSFHNIPQIDLEGSPLWGFTLKVLLHLYSDGSSSIQ